MHPKLWSIFQRKWHSKLCGLKSILIRCVKCQILAFDTPNTKIWASWGVSNAKDFGILLQYHLKYETVWTQMPNQTTNFLFNLFSLLSIFYSTFSLSSHRFVSLQPMFSLSFFFRSNSLTLKSTVQRRYGLWIKPPSPIKPPPSLLFWRLHRCWAEDAIVVGLMLPLPPQSEAACRLDLNPSQPQLEATTPLVWCTSQPRREADLSHYNQSKATTIDKESYHC